jgi:hypothetical protein
MLCSPQPGPAGLRTATRLKDVEVSDLISARTSQTPRRTLDVPVPWIYLCDPPLHLRASALCFAIVLLFSLSACAMQTTSHFDSTTWKSQRGVAAQQNQRGPLLASAEHAVRTDMSRDEVIGLLGEPDIRDAASAIDTYELGVAQYGIDEEFFEITYQDGKVASHRWGRR